MTKFDRKSFTVVPNPQVSNEEVERRWNETFGKKTPKKPVDKRGKLSCKVCDKNETCAGFDYCPYLKQK